MKKFLCVLLTLVLVLAAAVALAEDEKVLVIYSPNSDTEVDNIIPAFEDATGIKVELLSMGTGECVTRIDSEKENPQADVMWGGMNYGVYVQHPDLWAEYTSPNEALIDEGCDVIFVAAGASGNGVFTAAKEADGVYIIGCDVDQYDDGVNGSGNIILTSALKVMHSNVTRQLENIYNGTFAGEDALLGADTDSTGIVTEEGRQQLEEGTIEALNECYELLKSGEVTPASQDDFQGLK